MQAPTSSGRDSGRSRPRGAPHRHSWVMGLALAVDAGCEYRYGGNPLVTGVHNPGHVVVGDQYWGAHSVPMPKILIPFMCSPSGRILIWQDHTPVSEFFIPGSGQVRCPAPG